MVFVGLILALKAGMYYQLSELDVGSRAGAESLTRIHKIPTAGDGIRDRDRKERPSPVTIEVHLRSWRDTGMASHDQPSGGWSVAVQLQRLLVHDVRNVLAWQTLWRKRKAY
jgi:hypothetical protein